MKLSWKTMFCLFLMTAGCCGTYDYYLVNVQPVTLEKKLPGDVSLEVVSEPVYHHSLGCKKYQLHLKDGIEKQYSESLNKYFEKGVNKDRSETHLMITTMDTSTFPIATILNDIRIFLRIEIFKKGDKGMERQKTVMIYGFGCDADGNRALEKAIVNSFYQLMPVLEEMFIRQ